MAGGIAQIAKGASSQFALSLKAISDCRQSENCSSIICKRQSPSLRDLCSNVYFRIVRRFELTVNTTFDQCAYAVKSERVYYSQLLPPEYPSIRLWFRYDTFQQKLHLDCPG